jgi:hypothetical protein
MKYQSFIHSKKLLSNYPFQISELSNKVEESERFLQGIQAQYTHMQSELSDQLNSLTADREKVQKEVSYDKLMLDFVVL